ncbi:Pre-mRNA-splicing factor rse1 [Fusarium oxysporum f. sp. albedinis]|nr:Pre-mRNA-splicing factor rse1 [Fusarium oxysporum f. sp. albedinis]
MYVLRVQEDFTSVVKSGCENKMASSIWQRLSTTALVSPHTPNSTKSSIPCKASASLYQQQQRVKGGWFGLRGLAITKVKVISIIKVQTTKNQCR